MFGMNLLCEEDEIVFEKYEDLSYENKGELIELYVKGEYVGDMEVWNDSEMDGREYVTINYTIVYLDTIKKI